MADHGYDFVFILFIVLLSFCFFFFKQKTAYEIRPRDWSSDVCSSDLVVVVVVVVYLASVNT